MRGIPVKRPPPLSSISPNCLALVEDSRQIAAINVDLPDPQPEPGAEN